MSYRQKQQDRDDAAYRAILESQRAPKIKPKGAIREPSAVAIKPDKGDKRKRTIVCKACGWRQLTSSYAIGRSIAWHKPRCPKRTKIQPPTERPASRGKWDSPHRGGGKIAKPRRMYCPTCREEMIRDHDAWKCFAGCSNVAT